MDPEARTLDLNWADVPPVVRDFVHDPTYVTGLFGPLGSAKTSSGAMKAWAYAQAWPGAKIAVIRTTWPRLRDTTQAEFFKWFPPGTAGSYHITTKVLHLYTKGEPAQIMFRAMDDQKDIEDVLSLSLAAAWVDEPQGGLALQGKTLQSEPGIDHSLFLNLLSRLGRQPGYLRMCWLTGNPPDPSHWIAKDFGYAGHGTPTNPNSKFHLYLADQETNRRNLYHEYRGTAEVCDLCGQAAGEVSHQQGDYYRDLEELFGQGTPLAMRFIHGLWVPFKSLKPFSADHIQYTSDLPESAPRPAIQDCVNVLGVDPAITKRDEGCRSSLTLAGVPKHGLYRGTGFIWRNVSGHWSPYELCEKILTWVKEFPIHKIRIEDVAWQSALKDIVTREAELRGMHLPPIDPECKPKGDKLLCAMRWSGLVDSGRILFDPSCGDLIQCMLAVPMDKSAWDPVDATSRAIEGLPALRAERTALVPADEQPARQRAKSYAVRPLVPMQTDKARLINVGPRPHLRAPRATQRLRQRARSYAVKA